MVAREKLKEVKFNDKAESETKGLLQVKTVGSNFVNQRAALIEFNCH